MTNNHEKQAEFASRWAEQVERNIVEARAYVESKGGKLVQIQDCIEIDLPPGEDYEVVYEMIFGADAARMLRPLAKGRG